METYSFWIGIIGTVAFAISAVLAVSHKGIDLFGASVMGIITAVGGGTIRDITLNVPVFWADEQYYIWVALVFSILAFYGRSLFSRKHINNLISYMDAAGVALFAIMAVDKVWDLGFGLPLAPVMLGIITAIGGGLLRDVLADRPTLLMTPQLYAVPVMLGCILYVISKYYLPDYHYACGISCILIIFIIRVAAIKWNLSMPDWLSIPADKT